MECPHCHKSWTWDWGRELLVDSSSRKCAVLEASFPPAGESVKDNTVTRAMKCHCGFVICVDVVDRYNGAIFNHPNLSEVDWEEQASI